MNMSSDIRLERRCQVWLHCCLAVARAAQHVQYLPGQQIADYQRRHPFILRYCLHDVVPDADLPCTREAAGEEGTLAAAWKLTGFMLAVGLAEEAAWMLWQLCRQLCPGLRFSASRPSQCAYQCPTAAIHLYQVQVLCSLSAADFHGLRQVRLTVCQLLRTHYIAALEAGLTTGNRRLEALLELHVEVRNGAEHARPSTSGVSSTGANFPSCSSGHRHYVLTQQCYLPLECDIQLQRTFVSHPPSSCLQAQQLDMALF